MIKKYDKREYKKQYYILHKEKCNNYSKEWYLKNREHILQRVKNYKIEKFANYPWLKTYSYICRRVKHDPAYVKRGVKNYLTKKDVKFLWFRDNAAAMTVPSIDRKDGHKHYILENCRFLELTDNLKRKKRERQYV